MSGEVKPYIESCSFCGDGLLRFYRCEVCDDIVALCDECELMWRDIAMLSDDPNLSSDTSFPQCPSCGEPQAEFSLVTSEELEERKLDQYSAGESV